MQGSKSLKSIEEKTEFAKIFADKNRMGLSLEAIANRFNICIPTIYANLKDPEIIDLINEHRVQFVRQHMSHVDAALLKAAKEGDVRAIELVYERWDNYVPESKSNVNMVEENEEDKEKIKQTVKNFLDSLKKND